MTPIMDCIRKTEFKCTKSVAKAFQEIKSRITEAPIMRLLDISKVFKIACDTSGVGIGRVLSQKRTSSGLFQWEIKWSQTKIFHIWQGILCGCAIFVLLAILIYTTGVHPVFWSWGSEIFGLLEETWLKTCKWVEFLQVYTFVLKYKSRSENKVADALSHKTFILHTMCVQVTEFDRLKEDYELCAYLGSIFHFWQSDQPMRNREFLI